MDLNQRNYRRTREIKIMRLNWKYESDSLVTFSISEKTFSPS